ncbi:MAG: isoprenylcysteine carboxylmethyltransferase family protein, partial [Proteobacteria bacterium]
MPCGSPAPGASDRPRLKARPRTLTSAVALSPVYAPRMSDRPALVRYGDACFKHRGLMLPAAVLLLFIPSPTLSTNAVLTGMVGLLLALVGQSIRIANVGMVYIIRGGQSHKVYAETLVTGGLYNHVRNPMYVGNAFLLAGLAVASNAWVFAIGGILIGVAVHVGIIAAEEHFLRSKFGEQYVDYCRRVPRIVPRLGGISRSLEGVTFNGGRVIDKEYMEPVD